MLLPQHPSHSSPSHLSFPSSSSCTHLNHLLLHPIPSTSYILASRYHHFSTRHLYPFLSLAVEFHPSLSLLGPISVRSADKSLIFDQKQVIEASFLLSFFFGPQNSHFLLLIPDSDLLLLFLASATPFLSTFSSLS